MKDLTKKAVMSLILSIGIFLIVSQALAAEMTIKAGTAVPVRLEKTVTSETCTVGQTVRFSVTMDVLVDDIVVIKAGTAAMGEVTHAEESGSLGEEGALTLSMRETNAVDGTRVPLRATLSEHGKEKKAMAIMFCPFIKGTQCEIESGTETKAYVDFDTKINI